MNILFFYPANRRTIPIDIPLFRLQERGHNIFLFTLSERGNLHDLYEKAGATVIVKTQPEGSGILRIIRNVIALAKICRQYKIDVVHAHLQQAGLVAVFAQYLVKARMIIFRHHCKFHFLLKKTQLSPSKNEKRADTIINRLARKIIVPSRAVRKVMIEYEHVSPGTIKIIPYVYDFDSMRNVNDDQVNEIHKRFPAHLRIIMVSRLTPYKRHDEALKSILPLIHEGLDIQLLIMDDGPELEKIAGIVDKVGAKERIHLLGFQTNILDYIAAADVLLHPSLTEASNSAIKEAGLLKKIIIACDQVGDFNDYIVHGKNGFLLSADNFAAEATLVLRSVYSNPDSIADMGKNLGEAVVSKFGISDHVVDKYESL